MIILYFYLIISPVVWWVVWLAAHFFPKGRQRLRVEKAVRRRCVKDVLQRRQHRELILFHAASAGEFEQLKPLLQQVDRKRYYVVQSFYSYTVYIKEKDSPLFDSCLFHPLDSIISARLLFNQIQPQVYVVSRHDLWPSHLFVAGHRKVQTYLVNANLHTKSLRSIAGIKGVNRWMFESFSAITCGSQRLEENILSLAPKAVVHKIGETRFERVAQRATENSYDHFSYSLSSRKNVVFGSIITSDYDVAIGGYAGYVASYKELYRAIVVPHEVDQSTITQLTAVLDEYDLSWGLFTDDDAHLKDVIVVNVVGILAELYGYGFCAYVGAGFGAGVHSVIEPAAYGIPVFFGPNFHILDEAIEMVENGSGSVVRCREDVVAFLRSLQNSTHYNGLSKQTKEYVTTMQSGSGQIISLIESGNNNREGTVV